MRYVCQLGTGGRTGLGLYQWRNGYVSLTLVNFPPGDFDHFTPYFGQLSPLRLTLLPPVK